MNLPSIPWQPWYVALALGVLCLVLYAFARVQLGRAREDWANAFFYTPSLKAKQRQRRQRWQDWCWGLLAGTILCFVAAAVLYFLAPV